MFGSLTTHSTGMPSLDARDDFLRARRAQLAARATRWLTGRRRRPSHPRTLPEVTAPARRSSRRQVIALRCVVGYADQSHLNRECLRLIGLTPRAFLGETEAHCGCGHDHAASFMPVLGARPAPAAA
jgi:AraC-like DNA-binding protein